MPAAAPSRRRTGLRPAWAAFLVVVSALPAGCSSSGQTTTTATSGSTAVPAARIFPRISGPGDLLVRARDIPSRGARSPQGAILLWWRDLQSGNVAAARRAYASSVDTRDLGREIRELSYPARFDYLGDHPYPTEDLRRSRPRPMDVTNRDGTARVFATIDGAVFDRSDPSKVASISQTPVNLQLVREGRTWKLANDDYLAQALTVRPPGAR